MPPVNPWASYRSVATQTASPGQLVLMLFDGAIRFLECALNGFGSEDIVESYQTINNNVLRAQAIIHEPEVIILDEPTSGLDPKQIIEIRQLIKSLGKDHTVLLSTHILPEVSMVCNKVVIISLGRVVMESMLADLTRDKSLEQVFLDSVSREEVVDAAACVNQAR